MSLTNASSPTVDGVWFRPQILTAKSTEDSGVNAVGATIKVVEVTGVTTNADDFITLPRLDTIPNGHELRILCNASSNFELRTPATFNEEINSEDCDGTKEYLCTDTEIITVVKINNTIGWEAHAHSAIGAAVAAVVPD